MKIPFIILFVLLYSNSYSQFHLSAIFNDHMVFKGITCKNLGRCKSGDNIMVLIGAKKGSAVADKNGRWLITLPPFEAGGPMS